MSEDAQPTEEEENKTPIDLFQESHIVLDNVAKDYGQFLVDNMNIMFAELNKAKIEDLPGKKENFVKYMRLLITKYKAANDFVGDLKDLAPKMIAALTEIQNRSKEDITAFQVERSVKAAGRAFDDYLVGREIAFGLGDGTKAADGADSDDPDEEAKGKSAVMNYKGTPSNMYG